MPNVFSLIGSSWTFFRKQPALVYVLIWLWILPNTILTILQRMMEPVKNTELAATYQGTLPVSGPTLLFILPAILILMLVLIWGLSCTLVACRRMVETRAGRARTSFATLRKEGAKYVLPLLLTSILRTCFTFFWALLLVVPGIIYSIRTTFYSIIVVDKDLAYREALNRSKEIVQGRTWRILGYIIVFAICFFGPAVVLVWGTELLLTETAPGFLILSDIVSAVAYSVAAMLCQIALVELFAALNKKSRMQVKL